VCQRSENGAGGHKRLALHVTRPLPDCELAVELNICGPQRSRHGRRSRLYMVLPCHF
jgi:hypothetical protein